MTHSTATPAPAAGKLRGRSALPTAAPRRARVLTYAVLIVALAATLLPFVWMLLGSFKTQGELLRDPSGWLPQSPTLHNYTTWLGDLHIGHYFLNSLIVAVFTVLGNLLFCSMIGYALAKMDFPGKRLLFGLVMVTLMVPGVVTFVPLFVLVAKLHMVNTYPAMILPFLASPLGVFLMRQFMLGIPDSLLEAARIDGAGQIRTFTRIVMPLCGPPLATLAILTFLGSWNNFLWPLVAAQTEDKYTLPVALALYSQGQYGTQYGLMLAGSVLVIAPIVALFMALQRFFVQGIATVGLK
ncbi:carbohydrate ABC transporter permease [Streptomyces sp. NY05-11A]|uniref:carbohydrate ABC transporter permease n=1 Tax=Streptomyces soliscabiei TaxID=588897 RepID=UPI0029A700B1|nr:carbohydrate ABC transporter permease [Streptomyces sp. NY05-11A]MDX2680365.1 carbohydrate ABC transporter permease [Streptomyces sp. NY05-11A]